MVRKLALYICRWELSTPILWGVLYFVGAGIWGTILANFVGALIFFWVDKFIFTSAAVEMWHFKEKGICDECGKESELWRLTVAPNYDKRDKDPKFYCMECSKKKTDELRKKGIKIRGKSK
jgi:hypothetical protein